MKPIVTLFLWALLLDISPKSAFARKWTDRSGKNTIEAEFVSKKRGSVVLKTSDGKLIEIPLRRLSLADVKYVSSLKNPKEEPAAPKGPDDPQQIAELRAIGCTVLMNITNKGNVETVLIPKKAATDENLKRLAGLKHVIDLGIDGPGVSDAGLKHLADLTTLESLSINDSSATGTGLADLKKLTKLKRLDLSRSQLTDEGAKELETFPNLEQLKLTKTKITSKAADSISKLKNLRELWVDGTALDDEALKPFAEPAQLEQLRMQSTQVTGSGIVHLAKLKNLKELDFASCPIEEANLKHLYGMKQLKRLHLLEVKADQETWIKLFAALPDCMIFKPNK